jgi:hypothetical protein
MSIQPPQGILNIPNATLRVGKLVVNESVGTDTALNTIARNTILLVDDAVYHENQNWPLKLPNAWVGEFECNTASAGNYSEFNFYNEGASSNTQGYNLTFNDTAVELRYDGTLLKSGTLTSTVTGTGVKKVQLMFERTILSVTVDGTLVFTHDDTGGPRPRVYSTTAGGFLNFFTNGGALKNLKIVNEKWISDGTSNIAYVGGGEVAVGQTLTFQKISNAQVKMGSNVVAEYTGPHGRDPTTPLLKKFPEIAFDASKLDGNDTTNTYTQAGCTVTASGNLSQTSPPSGPFYAFNGIVGGTTGEESAWISGLANYTSSEPGTWNGGTGAQYTTYIDNNTSYYGDYLQIKLPTPIKLDKFVIYPPTHSTVDIRKRLPKSGKLVGSINGTTWTLVKDYSVPVLPSEGQGVTVQVSSTNTYNYFRLIVESTFGGGYGVYTSLTEWELYGYEENPPAGDTSVDTTFKSVLNTPQTSGVKVYVDGDTLGNKVTGPTPTGTATTYDSTGKYWELNGTLTSNIAVEANTFLEGDAPHSVSVWFNSSNLEANVSNTCVFSVSDQEHLNSQNLDLQSNTWHNLTYAYQGEGGSRVTYLDGRKVAEDQAEDTFGDYPPFAMTGYSQGGYVVSVSNQYDTPSLQLLSWKAFDNTTGTRWDTAGSSNYNTSGVHNGSVTTEVDGTPESGEWIQLEFPHKLRPSYFTLNTNIGTGGSFNYQERAPKTVLLVGSNTNNGTDWISLFNNTSTPRASTPSTTLVEAFTLSTTQSYKYFRLIVLTTFGGTSGGSTSISELQFYGHRENDLVRLPDPTNVLKYPHIAMTGPAQRGYVASESSNYNNLDRYAGWNAFDETVDDPDGWVSYPGSYSSGTPSTYSGVSQPDKLTGIDATSSGGDTSRNGSWLKIEVPHKLRLSQMKLFRRQSSQRIVEGFIYGSNDNSTFNQISNNLSQITNIGTYSNTDPLIIIPTDTTTPFKHFVVQVTRNDATSTHTNVGEWQLYGTEEASSVPIQIGGGNIDRVANFRVYDKFVGEDQALEIWDAQKDTFRGVKNSMTLHKGYLGIGTEEPEGRLAILDEPHNLEEFPPRAMTDYETYFEGHGVFKASASSEHSYGTFKSWNVFSRSTDYDNDIWVSGDSDWSSTDGTPTLLHYLADNTPGGAWLKIEMPYNIKLKSFSFVTGDRGYSTECFPENFEIWASNNGVEWYQIYSVSGFGNPPNESGGTTWGHTNVGSQKGYSKYAMVITKLYMVGTETRTFASIPRWKLFGTREQRQSVLHDGQLTLTKNLDVPRIGPPLDADDTPRRDRLVVEYNTSTNPTFEGAVRDTSGRGNDGVFYNGASYDAVEKALVFDGTGRVQRTHNFLETPNSNCHAFSVNLWFNHDIADPYFNVIFHTGGTSGNQLQMFVNSSDEIGVSKGGYDIDTSVVPARGSWYHVVWTYPGGDVFNASKIYVNGVLKTVTTSGSDPVLHKVTSSAFALGDQVDSLAGTSLTGSISNFKLYDTVLTASEVKTLYNMGRCDEGHHVVNFSKTRVGIGLGDGEAPRSALDVRDLIYAESSTVRTFTGQHICFPDESMETGLIVSAKKNQYVKLNGLATGKGAITIDESLPIVSLSNVAKDKACFGVVSKMEESNEVYRTEVTGGLVSESIKIAGDNRAIVNSVGEGAIWVVNTGGSLESGDYITTSNVTGYGQKQDGAGLMNYTVAKITMDCDFTATEVPVQTIKREETGLRTITEDTWNELVDYDRSSSTETQYSNTLVPSAYSGQSGYTPREVTTIVDYTDGSNTISVSEWSNLIPEIQNTYQSNTFTEIADYTKFVSSTEWSNLTADVQNTYSESEITTYYQIQRGENILDENGQLQFEDKTGATEVPYERRFLDVDGVETDEANAVHIAAFVGCTYHCG